MADYSLVPVDHQPNFNGYSLVPVDYDPFGADDVTQQGQAQPSPQAQQAQGQQAQPDTAPEPPDHGLSDRQKLSPIGKALSPITSYPQTYERMRNDALDLGAAGLNQMWHHDSPTDPQAHGWSDVLTGAAKAAIGGAGYVASPSTAAYRSIIGQPVEDVTGIPREYTEFAAQLATPGIGLARGPSSTSAIVGRSLPEAALGCAAKSPEILPEELAGQTRSQIRDLATEKGLVPKGDPLHPDYPRRWSDPLTNERRLRLDRGHVTNEGKPFDLPNAAVDHVHGYEINGKPIKIDGDNHIPTRGE
jgi:hypothetical protein